MVKNLLLLLSFSIGLSFNGFCQEFKYKKKIDKYVFKPKSGKLDMDLAFDQVEYQYGGIWAVSNGEFWGFVNSEGQIIGEVQYEEVKEFTGDFAIVKQNGKYGVIDKVGQEIIKPIYDKIDHYYEDEALLRKDEVWYTLENGNLTEYKGEIILRNPDVKAILRASEGIPLEEADMKLLAILFKNLRYPAEAKIQGIEGTVVTELIIDNKGHLDQVNVLRSIGGGCDEEAKRVISNYLKEWIPAMDEGQPAKSRIILPIKFKLG